MAEYDHRKIEKKWQKVWRDEKVFETPDFVENKEKFYLLTEFPYPSGNLHVGHWYAFCVPDIFARFQRMRGKNVLFPFGFDAFGLPAENAAIKNNLNPADWTEKNMAHMRSQIDSMGASFDFSREIATCRPDYYKWTQKLFLEFFKNGLVEQKFTNVNWCPGCKTVLANEQVVGGKCERCSAEISKKNLKQWNLKITKYADRLIDDLDAPNVILIHGWGGSGVQGWFSELREFCEKHKMEVSAENFPNAENPKYSEWRVFFDEKIRPKIRSNSIIVAHSLGGGFLQRYFTETDFSEKFAEMILIAPTVSDCRIPEIKNFFTEKFDYSKIKNAARKISIFGADNDEFIPKKDFEFLAKKLDANFSCVKNGGHFENLKTPIFAEFERIADGILTWPEEIKTAQKNWIGRSFGAEVDFEVLSQNQKKGGSSPRMDPGGHSKDDHLTANFDDETLVEKIPEVKFFYTKKFNLKKFSAEIRGKNGKIVFDGEQIFRHFILKSKAEFWIRHKFSETVFSALPEIDFDENFIGHFRTKNSIFRVILFKISSENFSVKTFYKCEKLTAEFFPKTEKITVFTTRIDTIFSGTFLILSPENPLVEKLTTPENLENVKNYQKKCAAKSDLERTELNKEKTGVFTGSFAKNPATGEKMPIWISDFVLANYGTGAVFADAHDERDFEMAQIYDIPLKLSIRPEVSKYLVIEKSLENAEENLKKFGEIKVQKTDENWGRFFEVSVPNQKEPVFVEFLKTHLLPSEKCDSFYADSIGASNLVVLRGKVFEVFDKKSLDEFKNYGRKIGIPENELEIELKCFSQKGILFNSGQFDGMKSDDAIPKIIDHLAEKGMARRTKNFKLRDWTVSRQRYWGCPIPIVHCEKCGPMPVDPEFAKYDLSGKKEADKNAASFETWDECPSPEIGEAGCSKGNTANSSQHDRIVSSSAIDVKLNFKFQRFFRSKNLKKQILETVLGPVVLDEKNLWRHFGNKKDKEKSFRFSFLPIVRRVLETVESFQMTTNGNFLFHGRYKNLVFRVVIARNKDEFFVKTFYNTRKYSKTWQDLKKNYSCPIKLPELENYLPREDGASPLAKSSEFVNTKCPKCNGKAHRETDTLDTFMCSSWYFLRYLDPKNSETFCDEKFLKNWLPIDIYSGGAEHTTMHLLYSRFFYKAMFDLNLVPTSEPYKFRMNRGLILGPDGNKMSKSKGNVIDPDALVAELGADTVRMYLAFIGPFNEVGAYPWSTDGIRGIRKFLDKVWRLFDAWESAEKTAPEIEKVLHQTIKKVSDDVAAMKFNTAISQLMIFVNVASKTPELSNSDAQKFLKLLSPFAPHLAEEIWSKFSDTILALEKWPEFRAELLAEDSVKYAVQINGKLRADFEMPKTAGKDDVLVAAKKIENVQKYLIGEIVKEIFVFGKIVGFVVK